MIQGNEIILRLVTTGCDIVVPFCNKTLRDKYDLYLAEAAIEGAGLRAGIAERSGVCGGFTTPLTLKTAPVLLGVMFGDVKTAFFVSGTQNMYQTDIKLCGADISKRFTLVEEWGNTKKEYADCVCSGFEIRIHREEALKAHLDIDSDKPMSSEQLAMSNEKDEKALRFDGGERFKEVGVSYFIDGKFYYSIYAATLCVNKTGGCKTELLVNRVLEKEDLPEHIDLLDISARMFREQYEERRYGTFHITLFNLDLISDETAVNSADAVIGPLHYAVSGSVNAAVYEER